MKTLVISDLHFKFALRNGEDLENNANILSFLRSRIGIYDLLILNGDIFDLWFDWRYTIIKQYFPLLKVLADMQEKGCKIVYISGNHDFWFNEFFPETLSIRLFQDSYEYTDVGRKIFVSHGDLWTVNDWRYRIFRRIIRRELCKRLFSILHPDLALSLGIKLSRSSRKRQTPPELRSNKLAGLQRFAEQRIMKNGYGCVVLGHSHEPCIIPVSRSGQTGYYVNSGDWLKHFSYVEIVDGIPTLSFYEPNQSIKKCGESEFPAPKEK